MIVIVINVVVNVIIVVINFIIDVVVVFVKVHHHRHKFMSRSQNRPSLLPVRRFTLRQIVRDLMHCRQNISQIFSFSYVFQYSSYPKSDFDILQLYCLQKLSFTIFTLLLCFHLLLHCLTLCMWLITSV